MVSAAASASETFTVPSESEASAVAAGEIVIYNKTANRAQALVAKTQFANSAGTVIPLKEGVTVKPGQTITAAGFQLDCNTGNAAYEVKGSTWNPNITVDGHMPQCRPEARRRAEDSVDLFR